MFATSQEDISIMEDEEDRPTYLPALRNDIRVQAARDSRPLKLRTALSKAFYATIFHLRRHAGAGVMASVAYFDPYVSLPKSSAIINGLSYHDCFGQG